MSWPLQDSALAVDIRGLANYFGLEALCVFFVLDTYGVEEFYATYMRKSYQEAHSFVPRSSG